MKILILISLLPLCSCSFPVYKGEDIVQNVDGDKVCGLHGTKLTKNEGYSYSSGLISPIPIDALAEERFPNTTHVGWQKEYDAEGDFQYTTPSVLYTCPDCLEAREKYRKRSYKYALFMDRFGL